ncbi:rRNA maturation RNase YbeY [Pollutimonas sp. M17]|uniref:rRNA maturation RNase YbeY n=1 Tax=Pollutimonas sp. M17 TaxID=2962065 RepID=UPI0021F4CDAA|nr:rRNA maturation RNase YbeY [Pollutimonas sp. M17]UYO92969.1 rRNA maturation RNase YbeY [Pollutimonas sp. M17]HWK72595.1 rRNA maturation RNase YbeY [Burkholderiaceae bacterium]
MSPDLSLVVQYATAADQLPRWRLRRWVLHALRGIARADGPEADALRAVVLTLRLVDADEGRRLNREFRGRDYATNVLTFEYGTGPDGTASGDVVLCVPVLHSEAAEQGKPLLDHAAHLTVHGVLHALGYDHIDPDEASTMEALEVEILGKMGIADPYQA